MVPEFVTVTTPPRPPPPVNAFHPAFPPALCADMPMAFAPAVAIEPALPTLTAPPCAPAPPRFWKTTSSMPFPPVLVTRIPGAPLVVEMLTLVSVVVVKSDPATPAGAAETPLAPSDWKLMPDLPAVGPIGIVSDCTKRLVDPLIALSEMPADWSPEQVVDAPAVVHRSFACAPRTAKKAANKTK